MYPSLENSHQETRYSQNIVEPENRINKISMSFPVIAIKHLGALTRADSNTRNKVYNYSNKL